MSRLPLAVYGQAMLTAVGEDGASSCAAMRAGIHGARQKKLWDYTVGDDLFSARPRLHQWWEGPTMLAPLATPVVQQCAALARQLGLVEAAAPGLGLPVLVLLPPADRPWRPANLEALVMDDLARRLGGPLPAGSQAIAGGRTGIAAALRAGEALLDRGQARACIIVGVESFLRQGIVDHYIELGRLKCGTNSNGFIPGEAACAVLVSRAGALPAADQLVIEGLGIGHEPGLDGGTEDAPVSGDGLTHAIEQAMGQAGVPYFDLHFSINDHNGERFKFKEAAVAATRLDRLPPEGKTRRVKGYFQSWHPAESIGEVGAATFPCLLGWAFEAGLKDYAPSPHALLHAGEDNGERVALVTRFQRGGAS